MFYDVFFVRNQTKQFGFKSTKRRLHIQYTIKLSKMPNKGQQKKASKIINYNN